MLTYFRIISIIEGISFLAILSVTVNIISRDYIFAIGMTHGVLFFLYFLFSLVASHKKGWSVIVWLLVLFASIIPFAFIAVEFFLKKEMAKE